MSNCTLFVHHITCFIFIKDAFAWLRLIRRLQIISVQRILEENISLRLRMNRSTNLNQTTWKERNNTWVHRELFARLLILHWISSAQKESGPKSTPFSRVGFQSRFPLHCHVSFFYFWFFRVTLENRTLPLVENDFLRLNEYLGTNYVQEESQTLWNVGRN